MKVIARQRLFVPLRAEEQEALQLAAIAKREEIAIAGAQQLPRKFAPFRQPRIGEHERTFGGHRAELHDRGAARDFRLGIVDDQRCAFAREEVHPLQAQRVAKAFAHHRDQLVDVVERRQLLSELGDGTPVLVAVAVDEHLDDGFDASFDRNQHAGDKQSRGEGEEVALQRGTLFDHVREDQVDCRKRDHAEDERDRVRQDLFDDDFDVPELVFENGDGEGERDERERQDRDRRVNRLHRSADEVRHEVDEQERHEAERHAEVNPLDLLLPDRGSRSICVRECDDRQREVDGEVEQLPVLNELKGAARCGDGETVAENEQVEVPRGKKRGRDVHRGDEPLVANDRPRKDEEEVERQRRQKNRREFFESLQHLVRGVDVAGRRVDVNNERQQRDEKEERRLRPPSSEQREDADGEVEKSDEAEDEVGVVDLQLGDEVRQPGERPSPLHDQRNFLADPPERFLQAFDLGRWRVADEQDLVAGAETAGFGAAAGVDGFDDDDAAVARKGEVDALE